MSLLFFIPWLGILYFTSKLKGTLLYYFVLFQFIFVGIGLAVFPFLGTDYLHNTFVSFDISNISAEDFNIASVIVLSGVVSLVASYAVLSQVAFRVRQIEFYLPEHVFLKSEVRKEFIFLMLIVSVLVCIPFILDNYRGFFSIIFATSVADITDLVVLRKSATSNYLQILFIYNLLPAATIVSVLYSLDRRRMLPFASFALFFLLASISLLLTYQKRPFLVFLGCLALAILLYRYFNDPINGNKVRLKYLILKLKWMIISLVMLLFLFYFFYTGYRFSGQPFETLGTIANVVFSRLFGRLSIPAAMYIDFFPQYHSFYGLENVGLLTRICQIETFLDSKVVFLHYSTPGKDGSVAASVFIDAYGQGGLLLPSLYGVILGFFIILLEFLLRQSGSGVRKSFLVVSAMIFLYYLSQASLFRSLLGYGGVFYLFVWSVGFKNKLMMIPVSR